MTRSIFRADRCRGISLREDLSEDKQIQEVNIHGSKDQIKENGTEKGSFL